ncbi:MAG: S-methyl-5'-thioinosine phosphorylase [Candidatus Nanopelagicales bacterium]
MTDGALGIIAGTGFYALDRLDDARQRIQETAYGPVAVLEGTMHGRTTYFVSRHGIDHSVPPHMVNYRAIIQALADLRVTQILAINVVGGIGHEAGELVVVDDFIDFTHQRPVTFFDGSTPEGVVHIDVGEPYAESLRQAWLQAAAELSVDVTPTGVYGAFEGPRFESRAEIRMARAAGVTVVGMTGVPEVVLAAERGIPYASLCLVANPAAGLSSNPITVDEVNAAVARGADVVQRILDCAAGILADQP